MEIEYRIARLDIAKAYFFNLRHSLPVRLRTFGVAAFLAALFLFFRYRATHGQIGGADILAALGWGVLYIFLLPALGMLFAREGKRTMSINPDGVEIRMGSMSVKIAWTATESIAETGDLVLITGKNGNVFTVPYGAFASQEQRTEFTKLAGRLHSEANNPSQPSREIS